MKKKQEIIDYLELYVPLISNTVELEKTPLKLYEGFKDLLVPDLWAGYLHVKEIVNHEWKEYQQFHKQMPQSYWKQHDLLGFSDETDVGIKHKKLTSALKKALRRKKTNMFKKRYVNAQSKEKGSKTHESSVESNG